MIDERLRPLFDKLHDYDTLFYILPDDRHVWLEVTPDEHRTGRDWNAYAVECDQRAREFRSFNRLPECLRALLDYLLLPAAADIVFSFRPDDWNEKQ